MGTYQGQSLIRPCLVNETPQVVSHWLGLLDAHERCKTPNSSAPMISELAEASNPRPRAISKIPITKSVEIYRWSYEPSRHLQSRRI